MKIKLLDNNFLGDLGSSKMFPPTFFEWDRGTSKSDVTFFTDNCLALAALPEYKKTFRIAWLVEPFPINPWPYQYVAQNQDKFHLILSHHSDFVKKLGVKGEFYQNGMSLIKEADWKPHKKTKFMSIVVSNKTMTKDHMFRHDLVKAIQDNNLPVDLYGRGYNFVEDKADALRDYKFSICLENCQLDTYISDKIIDAFATFTLPIYRGCPESTKTFNQDGVWNIQTVEDCINVVETLEKDQDEIYYTKAQQAMEDNFRWAQSHRCAEDYIFNKILKPKGLV